jgi:hypothetical protein
MERRYTNEELAGLYFAHASVGASTLYGLSRMKGKIAKSDTDFYKYFHAYGSLEGLKIDGIGKNTMRILERILRGEEII